MNNMEKKCIFWALGGPTEQMEKRVRTLKNQAGPESLFVLTGYESELTFMEKALELQKKFIAVPSFDTLSNVQNCAYILSQARYIIYSTSSLHNERIRAVCKKYYPYLLKKLVWIPSEEAEVKYAKVSLRIYKVMPKFLRIFSIPVRWKKFWWEYYLPTRN